MQWASKPPLVPAPRTEASRPERSSIPCVWPSPDERKVPACFIWSSTWEKRGRCNGSRRPRPYWRPPRRFNRTFKKESIMADEERIQPGEVDLRFLTLVMSLATAAWSQLGKIPHPSTQKIEKDIE